ncbi:hypothetical protein [Roseateles sp. PN1]|uniref:hypothetical protein n=1 Tax=Roseateles sp. PN1 TaxID=3137372 RepID=UPI003139643B
MRWPWGKQRNTLRLSVRCHDGLFAYVLTDQAQATDKPLEVLQWGVLRNLADEPEARAKAIRSLGLHAGEVLALLEPSQYQILKVDTPNVPAGELKAAARWLIKELVEVHLDDLTLDVMHVGGDVPRTQRQLFVVAARNAAITELSSTCQAAGLSLNVVDSWECALRNVQTAQARADAMPERATAALLMQGGQCLLTISVGGELFFTRRLDGDPRLTARATGSQTHKPLEEAPLGFEYTPGTSLSGLGMGMGEDSEESVLIIELQRSIDLWERSWPELPLARLYLLVAEHGDQLATLMQRELGLRTLAIQLPALFSGIAADADAAQLSECLPLLGAALRQETRAL